MATKRDAEYMSAIATGLVLERMISRKGSYSVIAYQEPGMTNIPKLTFYTVEGSPDAWGTSEMRPMRAPHGYDIPYAYQESALAHLFVSLGIGAKITAALSVFFRKVFRGKNLRCVICGRLHPVPRKDEPDFSEKIKNYFHKKKMVAYHDKMKYYLSVIPQSYAEVLASCGVNSSMCTIAVRVPSGSYTRFFGNCSKGELLAIAAIILDRSLFDEYRFMYD